ncbi:hypothetical protein OG453_07625 [Streptomyces sp. NBC_01381]|uniref:hypothetical protein n=1 Tax=Streptomyces sp. NBC_01381 TaxID=2903845 RepID=UPI0022564EB0|nr:hypothetical protein [Streptomyces sp. NBC_01381]MCX4666539.1 hypothetical protein [Streptomyces sp. NBC_01381]
MSSNHGTHEGDQSPSNIPAPVGRGAEAAPEPAAPVPRRGLQIQFNHGLLVELGGRTLLSVYVSPLVATGATALAALAGWGLGPWQP